MHIVLLNSRINLARYFYQLTYGSYSIAIHCPSILALLKSIASDRSYTVNARYRGYSEHGKRPRAKRAVPRRSGAKLRTGGIFGPDF